MSESLLEELVRQHGPEAVFHALTPRQRKRLPYVWPLHARPEQLPPKGDWTVWLILAGRGFGKSRAGAQFCISKAKAMPGSRGFLAARTAGDVRDVMIEGESGILAKSPPDFMPAYEPSKRRITWPNGSQATAYTSDAPGQGRGPQHHWGWGDELAAWLSWELWDNLQMGLRLGNLPQACVTTTPRPLRIIRELLKDPTCAVTRGSTYDNKANLPKAFFDKILRKYEGTRLGRQELLAELLDDVPGALWARAQIDDLRVTAAPEMQRIVLAIDPAATHGENSDMTGIVVCGLGVDGLGYVLEDLTCKMSPDGWARRAVDAYVRWKADRIVYETNQGGEMVEYTLKTIDPDLPLKGVHASRGKRVRAEPIAALYEQKKVHHVARPQKDLETGKVRDNLADLEDQMVQYTPTGFDGSPDRVDATVYALTELMLDAEPEVYITGVSR